MDDRLVYEKRILIRSEQVDMTRTLRISELFRIMEEASIAHTEELGCTRRKTLDRGLLWVIARQSAEIEEMPRYDDEIIIRSWQGEMIQMFFPRFYEIRKDGRCIIRGYAFWTLIDEKSREMIMPEDYDISIPARPGSEEIYIQAVVLPKNAEPSDVKRLKVGFSQVDINGHMNNTRYFDLVDDMLWEEASESGSGGITKPRSILANYVSELKAGTEITINEYRSGDSVFFEGSKDKTSFRIRYTF